MRPSRLDAVKMMRVDSSLSKGWRVLVTCVPGETTEMFTFPHTKQAADEQRIPGQLHASPQLAARSLSARIHLPIKEDVSQKKEGEGTFLLGKSLHPTGVGKRPLGGWCSTASEQGLPSPWLVKKKREVPLISQSKLLRMTRKVRDVLKDPLQRTALL